MNKNNLAKAHSIKNSYYLNSSNNSFNSENRSSQKNIFKNVINNKTNHQVNSPKNHIINNSTQINKTLKHIYLNESIKHQTMNTTNHTLYNNSKLIFKHSINNKINNKSTIVHKNNHTIMTKILNKTNLKAKEKAKLISSDENTKLFIKHKKIASISSISKIEDEIKKISFNTEFKNCLEFKKFNFRSFIEIFAVIVIVSMIILLIQYLSDYNNKSSRIY